MRKEKLAAVLLLSLASCLTGAGEASTSPALWIDVPFFTQTTDGCGSASIAMVMAYWDGKNGRSPTSDADPSRIQAALFSPSAKGIYASRMKSYFEQSGYRVFSFAGKWKDLEQHLASGRPLIVGLKASGLHGPLHYVVVVGIDSARGYVFVNDPARQKMLRISREGFEKEWSATGDWTLLALPRLPH